jgi:hypothetical protein
LTCVRLCVRERERECVLCVYVKKCVRVCERERERKSLSLPLTYLTS